MSDEPSNTASEFLRNAFALLTQIGVPSEEALRAGITNDFTYEDRRRGVSFPDADAESAPRYILSLWETGAGRPRWESETLAVRAERYAAVTVQTDYGNGMLVDSIIVIALDASLRMAQRQVDFDVDNVEGAIAELDRMHSQSEAS